MALTEKERMRVRYHLGFPQVAFATILALGVPAAGHPAFLLESAMNDLLPEAEDRAREVLRQCDCIEVQMTDARSRMKLERITGELIFRSREEIQDLEEQYVYWTDNLVDIFGVNKNPFSKKHQNLDGAIFVTHA